MFVFQIPISLVTILINSYCLTVLLLVREIRRLDYFLVGLQVLSDLLFSGVLSFYFFATEIVRAALYFCDYLNNDVPRYDSSVCLKKKTFSIKLVHGITCSLWMSKGLIAQKTSCNFS